ncbi:hypothetical protein ACH4RG_23020 [Streptomyces sp. NPDC021019]|uniref:hypothetical protein n=1 Tax=Streptomyces sp. NPDC021019 TaxID=3365108 RepID=UPI0037B0597A
MATSGSYTPAAIPECPYAPRMTRAAALALRAAGGLRENCVVVLHTDTPTIGTAGNTSATEIELNPVGPSEFGATARVRTSFAASAWAGTYDIDLGAAGSITRLTDDWGNTVEDVDADAPTVHGQFPWHAGSATIRDNRINDVALPNWGALTGAETIADNRIIGGTVDLGGTGTVLIQSCELHNVNIIKSGATNLVLSRSEVRGVTAWTLAGAGGTVTVLDCDIRVTLITRDPATTSPLFISGSTLNGSQLVQDAGAVGAGTLSVGGGSVLAQASLRQVGPGAIGVIGSSLIGNGGFMISNLAGTTRALSINNCLVQGFIRQERTNGTTIDTVSNSQILGQQSALVLTGAAGAAGGLTPVQRCSVLNGSVVTITDPAASGVFDGSHVDSQSTVNIQAGGSFVRSRAGAQATVNTGAFLVQSSIVDGQFTKTATAVNSNRLANKGFDDWV